MSILYCFIYAMPRGWLLIILFINVILYLRLELRPWDKCIVLIQVEQMAAHLTSSHI